MLRRWSLLGWCGERGGGVLLGWVVVVPVECGGGGCDGGGWGGSGVCLA